ETFRCQRRWNTEFDPAHRVQRPASRVHVALDETITVSQARQRFEAGVHDLEPRIGERACGKWRTKTANEPVITTRIFDQHLNGRLPRIAIIARSPPELNALVEFPGRMRTIRRAGCLEKRRKTTLIVRQASRTGTALRLYSGVRAGNQYHP